MLLGTKLFIGMFITSFMLLFGPSCGIFLFSIGQNWKLRSLLFAGALLDLLITTIIALQFTIPLLI